MTPPPAIHRARSSTARPAEPTRAAQPEYPPNGQPFAGRAPIGTVPVQAAGLSFILGTKIPRLPQVIAEWRGKHPGQQIPDGHGFIQPWPATSSEKARGIPDRVIYYQYRADRARRTLRGIDEQVAKGPTGRGRKGPRQT